MMIKVLPLVILSLLLVGCESRADKIRQACGLMFASNDDVLSQKYADEIYKLSGTSDPYDTFSRVTFCRMYRSGR